MKKLSLATGNNALERMYFIGGPPRVGKSILSFALAKKIGGHVVSTDSIRDAAKKACPNKESDYFIINEIENVPDDEWLKNYLETPEKVVEYQNRESRAVWTSVVAFCNSFAEDNENHIVEGVALLPELVANLKQVPKHIAYVGNTNEKHIKSMLQHAESFPGKDWMVAMGYGKEKIEGMASFVKRMSEYFKEAAEKYTFPYYEIDDDLFDQSVEKVVEKITGT